MPMWKSTTIAILMLVLSGLVKAHIHFIRLALLLILGLAGMYMLHKLAQDWNRIRGGGGGGGGSRPQRLASAFGTASRLFRISKRSVDTHVVDESLDDLITKFSNILYLDPIGCARKFVCSSASKPTSKLTKTEFNLLQIFNRTDSNKNDAFKVFQKAAILGRTSKNDTLCETTYKACFLSTKQLFAFFGAL